MALCVNDPYTLPSITFVGGETQNLSFHTYSYYGKKPFNLAGCTCNFSVVSFNNKNGVVIISKPMQIASGGDAEQDNVLQVTLTSQETVSLAGKYIYQITITDIDGESEIPNQGILFITKNINESLFT